MFRELIDALTPATGRRARETIKTHGYHWKILTGSYSLLNYLNKTYNLPRNTDYMF